MATKTVTILLVEDDEVDIKGIQRALRKHKVVNPMIVVNDGVEALEVLRRADHHTLRPYLILLDINMPRMNGIEFLREVRNDPQLRDSIVFVLTTSRADEDRFEAYHLNVAGYIVKADAGSGFMNAVDMLDRYWKIVEFP